MIVAVTGGAGFIGSHLCDNLVKDGNHTICIDNFFTSSRTNINHLSKKDTFRFCQCDVRDFRKLCNIFKKNRVELVYHLAAVVGVKKTFEIPEEVLEVNIKGTENVLKAALKSGTKRVVHISSSEVYGNPIRIPSKEEDPKNIELPYAASKLIGEKYAEIYANKFGLETVSLRLFNIYGPRQRTTEYGFVVGEFITRVLNDKPPIIYGDGSQTRDFTYIDDCIRAMRLSAIVPQASGEVLNLGTGNATTILDLAKLIIRLCQKKVSIDFQRARTSDIWHRCADITKAHDTLMYIPQFNLEQGLAPTIEWYKQILSKNTR